MTSAVFMKRRMHMPILINKEVRIETTNICNYHCIMCPREKQTRTQGIMSMALYQKILDQLSEMGVEKIVLTGFGEPFKDFFLEEKILAASVYGFQSYVISNCSLWHLPAKSDPSITRIEAAIASGLNELRISFYGHNKHQYQSIMEKSNYDQVIKNLELLKRVKEKYDESCEVSHFIIQFDDPVVWDDYPQQLKDIVDYYEIWKPHNFGDGRNYRQLDQYKTTCGRPERGPLQINWDGTMVPCCYDYNKAIVLGDINVHTIKEIVRGTEYEKLREEHRTRKFNSYCSNCDQLCGHSDAIVFSNNPRHEGLSNEEIVKRTNTDPRNSLT